MSDTLQSKRDSALDFLDELDGKHDLLLTELDSLNARIYSILAEYAKSRQAAAGAIDASATIAATDGAAGGAKTVENSTATTANASTQTQPVNLN